jgi:hypothetical protein
MRMTKQQLRRIVREAVRSKIEDLREAPHHTPKPEKGTSLATRAPARAAAENPEVMEAVDHLVGAVGSALIEMMPLADPDAEMDLDQSVHTDFHNELMEFVEDWMSTYTEAFERGDLGG